MSDERELKKLQDAFPGIWVREDGAFRYEPFGMYWEPGDVESDLSYEEGMIRAPNSDGRVLIRGDDYGRGEAKLKLSQIQALADYITAIDSSLAAARIRAKREAGEAAIAALSPAVELTKPAPKLYENDDVVVREAEAIAAAALANFSQKSAPEIPEGFTPWRGTAREGPIYDVFGSAPVEALLRDGRRETSARYDFDWSPTGSPDDIIAYRVVSGDA